MKTMRVWLALIVDAAIMLPGAASAASAEEIDANADVALKAFAEKVDGAQGYLDSAKGVLVFPKVVKAGFIIGGEGGEGALQVGGKTVDYYSTIAGSFGLQAGAVSKSVYILFMTDDALQNFRNSNGCVNLRGLQTPPCRLKFGNSPTRTCPRPANGLKTAWTEAGQRQTGPPLPGFATVTSRSCCISSQPD